MIFATAAAFATGCGGGTEPATEGSEAAVVAQPEPKRPIAEEVAGFERALQSGARERFMPFVFSTLRGRPPGSPATRAECREEPLLAKQYAHRIGPPITRS